MTEGDNTLVHEYVASLGLFSQTYRVEQDANGAFLPTEINVPLDILYQMPNSSSEVMTLTLQTRTEDGTILNSTGKNVQVNCPTNIVPTIGEVTVTKINDVDGKLIQNVSSVEVSVVNSSGAYGSAVESVWISVDNKSGENPFVSDVFTTSGDVIYTIRVTDSRGHSAISMRFLEVNEGMSLLINSLVAERCDADGSPNVKGTCARMKVDFGSRTSETVTESTGVVRIKESDKANWATVYEGTITTGEWITFTSMSFGLDKSYDIELTLSDSYGMSLTATTGVGTAYVFMRWEPQSDMISFGCYPLGGMTKCLQLADDWVLYHGSQNIYDVIHPVGCVIFMADSGDPSITLGGQWSSVGALSLGGNTVYAWKKTSPILIG